DDAGRNGAADVAITRGFAARLDEPRQRDRQVRQLEQRLARRAVRIGRRRAAAGDDGRNGQRCRKLRFGAHMIPPALQPACKYVKPPSLIYNTQPSPVDGECDAPRGNRSQAPRANAPPASWNEPSSTNSSAPLA